jgi:DNA-binding Xre family transcriptional regulator
MPTIIDIEFARRRWETRYNHSLSDDELIAMAKISMSALLRMRTGTMHMLDLRKILALCKALECDPSEVIKRESL